VTARKLQEKNKSQKSGTLFITTKPTTNSPQSTIKSPRIHHSKTIRKTPEPLENRTLHHTKFNPQDPAPR
jgi:hypothetical protein